MSSQAAFPGLIPGPQAWSAFGLGTAPQASSEGVGDQVGLGVGWSAFGSLLEDASPGEDGALLAPVPASDTAEGEDGEPLPPLWLPVTGALVVPPLPRPHPEGTTSVVERPFPRSAPAEESRNLDAGVVLAPPITEGVAQAAESGEEQSPEEIAPQESPATQLPPFQARTAKLPRALRLVEQTAKDEDGLNQTGTPQRKPQRTETKAERVRVDASGVDSPFRSPEDSGIAVHLPSDSSEKDVESGGFSANIASSGPGLVAAGPPAAGPAPSQDLGPAFTTRTEPTSTHSCAAAVADVKEPETGEPTRFEGDRPEEVPRPSDPSQWPVHRTSPELPDAARVLGREEWNEAGRDSGEQSPHTVGNVEGCSALMPPVEGKEQPVHWTAGPTTAPELEGGSTSAPYDAEPAPTPAGREAFSSGRPPDAPQFQSPPDAAEAKLQALLNSTSAAGLKPGAWSLASVAERPTVESRGAEETVSGIWRSPVAFRAQACLVRPAAASAGVQDKSNLHRESPEPPRTDSAQLPAAASVSRPTVAGGVQGPPAAGAPKPSPGVPAEGLFSPHSPNPRQDPAEPQPSPLPTRRSGDAVAKTSPPDPKPAQVEGGVREIWPVLVPTVAGERPSTGQGLQSQPQSEHATRVAETESRSWTPPAPPEPVRELRWRAGEPGQEAGIQVRLERQTGQVSVTVRTPDAGLREALREGLPELAARLGEQGLETRLWRPTATDPQAAPAERSSALRTEDASSRFTQADSGGRGFSGHGSDPQRHGRDGHGEWIQSWEEMESLPPPHARGFRL